MDEYAGWIYFNVDEARKHLLKHGFVYTMRRKGRKEGWGWAKHGRKTLGKGFLQLKKWVTELKIWLSLLISFVF